MRNLLGAAAMTLAAMGSLMAVPQMGTVSSAAAFQLRGATITPGNGVPDWPVLEGDTINALTASTPISFSDGSTISLGPNSVGKVTMAGQMPVFQLVSGNATYSLKSLTAIELRAGKRLFKPISANGSFTSSTGVGFWAAPGHAAFLASVGGATVAAAGVSAVSAAVANSGGTQISPSH
jgi:hypothetical protein